MMLNNYITITDGGIFSKPPAPPNYAEKHNVMTKATLKHVATRDVTTNPHAQIISGEILSIVKTKMAPNTPGVKTILKAMQNALSLMITYGGAVPVHLSVALETVSRERFLKH